MALFFQHHHEMDEDQKGEMNMTLQPEGESLRRAVKWLSEERVTNPDINYRKLIEDACLRFNLNPKEEAYLLKNFKT